MACNCTSKGQWEVVAVSGKVVFTNTSKATAEAVARRYPESTVREKPKEVPATTQ